jgi:hypothetical protein
MAATGKDIRGWLERGKVEGARFMLVVCDTYDYEDYPVFVKANEDINEKAKEYNSVNMQRIMECYDLSMDFDQQLDPRRRAWNGWKP